MDEKSDLSSKNEYDKENCLRQLKFQNKKIRNINDNLNNFFMKKINFSSAFDHKGCKQFLNSKKEALQLIVLDEDNLSSHNEGNEIQDDKYNLKKLNYQNILIENGRPKSSHNLMELSNKSDNNGKSKDKKKFIRNEKNKEKKYHVHHHHVHKTLVEKEFRIKKKFNKFFSSQELKMFEDKDIRKIKPIKNTNIDLKYKKEKNKISYNNFIESGISNDSSLFNIVSQIK